MIRIGPPKKSKFMYVAGREAALEYTDRNTIRKKSPKISLLFTPFLPPLVPVEIVSQDIGGLITDVHWVKSRSLPGGFFQVTMIDGGDQAMQSIKGWPLDKLYKVLGTRSFEDIFKPMMLAQLWVDGYHVMTGYLTRRYKNVSAEGEKTYNLEFAELGNLYNNSIAAYELLMLGPNSQVLNTTQSLMDTIDGYTTGLPMALGVHNAANAFIFSTLLFGLRGAFGAAPFMSFSDGLPAALRMIALPCPLGGLSTSSLLGHVFSAEHSMNVAGGTSFWDYLKTQAPEPYMELFCESGGRTIVVQRLLSGSLGAAQNTLTSYFKSALESGATGYSIPSAGVTPMLPGLNYLIMRTAPFENYVIGSSLYAIPYFFSMLGLFDMILGGDFIILTDNDIVEKSLGVSMDQQYTVFETPVTSKASSDSGNPRAIRTYITGGPAVPIFPGGARTYGARHISAPLSFSNTVDLGAGAELVQSLAKKFSIPLMGMMPDKALASILACWKRNAGKYKEGQITTRYIPYARPGMYALYQPTYGENFIDDARDVGSYYIDNIDTTVSVKRPSTTTFNLIHGTPLPTSLPALSALLLDWEFLPTGLNLWDYEPG